MKVKTTDVIVPRWVWLTYFTIVILGADHWLEAVGGLGMCLIGLVRLNDVEGA